MKIDSFTKRILVQSMTNTKTKNIDETLQQIIQLHKLGCDLVRVALFDNDDVDALTTIVAKSPIPIIADIHFNYQYAIKAIQAGVGKIRLNPGNINKPEEVIAIINEAKKNDVWIRIGVNCGSIEEKYLNKYKYIPDAMIAMLEDYLKIFEEENFKKIVISLKSSDPLINVEVNELAFKRFKFPIHLGVTEAGTLINATLKSAIGLSPLLLKGIGNTIRISISDSPLEEVKVAHKLLNILKIEQNRVNIIACPTCGRLSYDIFDLVHRVEAYCNDKFFPLTISILGCVVNGIGEGKHADIGVAGSNNKTIIFSKGKIIKTIDSSQAYDELVALIDQAYEAYLKTK